MHLRAHFVSLLLLFLSYSDLAAAEDVQYLGFYATKRLATFAPRPQYPKEARAHYVTGEGVFTLRVRRDGSVSRVAVQRSTGHAILDKSALEAFRRWRFVPGATKPKVAIPMIFTMARPSDSKT